MTYLVTGCAGFIGSHVTQQLLDQGESVIGVDDLNDHYDPTLKDWRLKQLKDRPDFTFHLEDIADQAFVSSVFEDNAVGTVYNLAAHAGVRDSLKDPQSYLDVNADGALNLLEACRQHDVDTFLLASTSSLYGHHNEVPFSEEATTDQPPSPYAATKKAAEALAATYAELYGIDCPVPRYFTVYGPAGRPGMAVFRFIRWVAENEPITIYGDGTQKRDFTYVDDIARGTLLAAEKIDGFEIVNLGNDSPVELRELIRIIESHLGKEAELRFTDSHPADLGATWASIDKARKMLGWEPQTGLEDGIQRTVEWYQAQREWAKTVDLGEV